MPRSDAPHRRPGRPPRTSRAQVLAAARQVIERDGWEKLTIRRVAAEIGVGAMTLYHHVQDREDLLIQLINEQADRLGRPDLPAAPRDRIVVAATAIHDALAAWPWAAEVLTTDGFLSRVGESARWMVEAIVAGAVEAGCTEEQAVSLFRSIWYYTVGEILVRARSVRRGADDGGPGDRDPVFSRPDPSLGDLDPSGQPHLAAIGERWAALAARDTYPEGLRGLVDGMLAHAARGTP